MTNQIKPWDRQIKETAKAYEAFIIYRELGLERSYPKVAQRLLKSGTLIKRWSAKYNWTERIAEFDSYVSSKLDEQYIEKTKDVNREHLKLLEASRRALMSVIVTLNDKLETGGLKELEGWSLEKLFDYLKLCLPKVEQIIKLERLLRGLSTDHLEVTGSSHEDTEKRYYVNKEGFEIFSRAVESVYAERSKNKAILEINPNVVK